MNKIYTLLLLFLPVFINAQTTPPALDGDFPMFAASSPGHLTPGGYFDVVFDRFGNRYSLNDIAVHNNIMQTARTTSSSLSTTTRLYTGCTPGYFRIYLETGCGMDLYATNPADAANLAVLCQVLTDISNFIPSPCTTTRQTVNVWVRGGLSAGLGVATPFFNIPYSLTETGIADNTVWETLNSGVDAFQGVAPPLFTSGGGTTGTTGGGVVYLHGSIAFNFGGSINWHTDLTSAPAIGEEDLYTVALHEMMHIMGFCTLIDYNGRSVFDMYNPLGTPATWQYYSRYDTHLETHGGVPLIIDSFADCNMYQYKFNPAAGVTANAVLSPGGTTTTGCAPGFYTLGGETDTTVCATAVQYLGGWGTPIPVYTPQCFERGGSLSHFDDQCYVPPGFCPLCSTTNCEYFVMSNSAPNPALGGYSATTNPGLMKRYLTPEERQALCDIGYPVNTTYGSAADLNYKSYSGGACPGAPVVGFNDGLTDTGTYAFATVAGGTVNISGPSLGYTILDNDRSAGASMSAITGCYFKCLQVMTGTGTVSADSGGVGTNVTYTAGVNDYGVQLLRYIPVNASHVAGNITYVYVFVGSGHCIPSACNMVVNGGFENPPTGVYGLHMGTLGYTGPNREYCWTFLNGEIYFLAADAPYLLISVHPGELSVPDPCEFRDSVVHPLSDTPNNHFVELEADTQGVSGWECGGMEEQLSTPLLNGTNYTVSFWALLGGGGTCPFLILRDPTHLQFMAGNAYPLTGSSFVPAGYMPSGYTNFATFTISATDAADYQWHFYSDTFTYNGPPNTAGALLVQAAPWLDGGHPSAWNEEIGLDDISVIPTPSACFFSLIDSVSIAQPPFSLAAVSTTCVPGGTYSWPGMPVVAGSRTNDTSGTFNPADADSAALAVGDASGIIPVSYTYTTSLGCKQTLYGSISIDSLPPVLHVTPWPASSPHVYPNPANNTLNIDFPASLAFHPGSSYYSILSVIGTQVQQGPLSQVYNSISIGSLAPGVYILEITDTNGQRILTKIVKR